MFRLSILILISFFLFSCNMTGCKDEEACNYSSSALGDDGSCWYSQDNCGCEYGPNAYRTEGYSYWNEYICGEECWEECWYWDYYTWDCLEWDLYCYDVWCYETIYVEGECQEG